MPTTTQQNISPIHPTLRTPHKNTPFPQTTIHSTVKPSVVPKFSQRNYQTYRSITKTRQLNKQNLQLKTVFQIKIKFFLRIIL